MKYLTQFLKKEKKKTILTLIFLLGQVAGTLLIPYLVARIVDDGILTGNLHEIYRIGILMLLVSLAAMAVSVLGSYYSADLAALFGKEMREKLFRKTQNLSVTEFNSIGVSSMITRATSDISNLQQILGILLQLVIPAPIIVIVSIIMTAQISIFLSLLLTVCVVIFVIFSIWILKKSNHLSRIIQSRLDTINQVIRESITGIRVIRAFGNESYEEKRSSHAFFKYADNMISLNKLFAVLNPVVWLIMGLSLAAILWLGGSFSLNGTMEIGEITAVTEYAIITLSYLILATTTSAMLPKLYSCLNRLSEVLGITTGIQDTETTFCKKKDAPVLEFDHVSFSYQGAEDPVIHDLSFHCVKGQTTAIIGSTGSGKSTIADLILRLHNINFGEIRLQGVNICDIPQKELRNEIGYVPQKAFLFSGTIEENLKMGNEMASENEIKMALSISQSDSFVNHLPLGTKAPVSQGGSNFSGGQKQRLSIARALVKRVPVYIFDDSFSALDVKTDAALRKALQKELTEAVKIVIAQRVSTIMDADQILVLDEGRLVGIGTHNTLMNTCSVYQAIAESQMNGKENISHE